jgi:hypothetical protein
MNRNDWVFVGIRLYGMYLLVDAVLSSIDAMRASGHSSGWQVARLIVMFILALVLFIGTSLLVSWLQRKDDALARADHAARTPTAPS